MRLEQRIGRMMGASADESIELVDERVDLGRLCRISWAVLQLLPVVEKEAAVVSAVGESADEAAAAAKRTAEVVPPGLAEVEAIGQRRSRNRPIASVDRLQRQRLVGDWLIGELVMQIRHQAMSFGHQSRAETIWTLSQFLCLLELTQALLTGPWTDPDVLRRNQAHRTQTLQRGVDPAVHRDIG